LVTEMVLAISCGSSTGGLKVKDVTVVVKVS
jgi:hypothetical protein